MCEEKKQRQSFSGIVHLRWRLENDLEALIVSSSMTVSEEGSSKICTCNSYLPPGDNMHSYLYCIFGQG